MTNLLFTILAVVFIGLVGYIVFLRAEVTRLANKVVKAQDSRNRWKVYANELRAELDRLDRHNSVLSSELTDYRIEKGNLPAYKVGENGHKTYALELDNMPKLPKGAKVGFSESENGILVATMPELKESDRIQLELNKLAKFENRKASDAIYAEYHRAIEAEKAKESEEKKAQKSAKVEPIADEKSTATNDSSKRDVGSFEAVNTSDDKALLTSDKFGELIDLVSSHLKVKTNKIPSAKFEYMRSKFLQWEKSKNPCDAKEYCKRLLDNNFGGK